MKLCDRCEGIGTDGRKIVNAPPSGIGPMRWPETRYNGSQRTTVYHRIYPCIPKFVDRKCVKCNGGGKIMHNVGKDTFLGRHGGFICKSIWCALQTNANRWPGVHCLWIIPQTILLYMAHMYGE